MRFYPQTKLLLVLAVLVSAAAGYVIYREQPAGQAVEGAGDSLLPELSGRVGEIDRVILTGPPEVTTLKRQPDGAWVVSEKGDYPAVSGQVRDFLLGLEEAEKQEPKTADKAYFERLGLVERFVEIEVFSGEEKLANLKTGDQFYSPTGEGILTFIYDPETDRAWTLTGLPEISPDPAFWLAPDLLSLSELRIKRLEVKIGENQVWAITKDAPLDPGFKLEGADGGRANTRAVNAAALVVNDLTFDDIIEVDPAGLLKVAEALYSTFDGLSVKMEFYEKEGLILTTLEAAYDETVLEQPETPAVLPDVPPDGASEAASLNRKWGGRVFQIPLNQLAAVLKFREEFFRTR